MSEKVALHAVFPKIVREIPAYKMEKRRNLFLFLRFVL